MKTIISFILVASIIFLISCERVVEVELPEHTSKFVVNSILEPGEPIHVFVTLTKGVLRDGRFDPVRDAVVELIEEGGKSYFLTFKALDPEAQNNFLNGYTTDELEIKAGKTYEIIVSGRLETATSIVTVPELVAVKSFDIIKRDGNVAEFTVTFDDPVGDNFYEFDIIYSGLEIRQSFGGNIDSIYHVGSVLISALNPLYQSDYAQSGVVLINDAIFDGKEAKIEFTGSLSTRVEVDVTVTLRNVTESYYRYHTSLGLQRNNEYDLFAQPVQVFGNINNGRGAFLGSSPSSYTTIFSFN